MANKKSRKRKSQASNGGYDDYGIYTERNQAGHPSAIPLDENGFIAAGYTVSLNQDDFAEGGDGGGDDDGAPYGGPGSQVLPVATYLMEDWSGEPEDGEEYLFSVRREAATHPKVYRSAAFPLLVTSTVTTEAIEVRSIPSYHPSEEWRTTFLNRLENVRKTFVHATHTEEKPLVPEGYLPIPAAADESSWKSYIFGRKRKAPTASTAAQPAEGDSLADAADSKDETSSSSSYIRSPKPPIPAVLLSLDQGTTISLLEHFNTYLTERIEAQETVIHPSTVFMPPSLARRKKPVAKVAKQTAVETVELAIAPALPAVPAAVTRQEEADRPSLSLMTPLDGQWLFSLLSVLDGLLTSSEISVLRTLSRTCEEIAEALYAEHMRLSKGQSVNTEAERKFEEAIASCYIVKAAAWGVWGQRDLWE